MFAALGRLVAHRPWYVVAAWVVAAVVVVSTAPALTSTQDQSEFLPRHYESVQAQALQQKAFPERGEIGAIVVFDRSDGGRLSRQDQAKVAQIATRLNTEDWKSLGTAAATPGSHNGLVQAIFMTVQKGKNAFDPAAMDDAKKLRSDLEPLVADTGLSTGVTGPAAQSLDSQESSETALAIVGIATVALIVGLLALIFRSVLVSLMPIIVVGIVSFVATGLIAIANEAFDLKADSSIQVILVVVLYGIGTDYILFFLFRYREALRNGEESRPAVAHAVERAGEAIASAGGAVIVSFMALVLSSLVLFRAIGPALAIAVATTVVAALTLVPAVVSLIGSRAIFWPSKSWRTEPDATRFRALGASLARRPVRYAASAAGLLAVLSVFALGFTPTFDFSDSGSSSDAESVVALKTFQKGQARGAADPTSVLVTSTDGSPLSSTELTSYAERLGQVDGVAQAGLAGQTKDGSTAVVSLVLADDPASDAALANVRGPIRAAAHSAAPEGTQALVGGTTSVFVDLRDAMDRDYSVVFPVAALVIMLILALLLRSLVAPWYLMASVGLGFGATLGATVIVFQHLLGQDGLIFMLPIYIYLFVVALGTDYNILMIARLREEARGGLEPRPAAAKAIEHAGPTVAAAGVILAGTFASLMLGGNALLQSMGFALSIGILIAAFVMALFLTPSLTALIGHAAWWPGHADQGPEPGPTEPAAEEESEPAYER
ncbi:MAG: MMPL family transporter [Nocardioidaceae bacterium]|nr:MMPL family transporter [Nocardioidaceae bacterium]NUS50623.1 MMPL family transporter [Nocardioidaceae bacterium]